MKRCIYALIFASYFFSPLASPLALFAKSAKAEYDKNKIYPIAIVGAGASGAMAAKRAVLNNRDTLLFTGAKKEKKHSRGHWVKKVENVPGLGTYKKTLRELTEETLKSISKSPFHTKLILVEDSVVSIKKELGHFKLRDKNGNDYLAKHVILATGMMDEQPHIRGSIRPILSYANNQTVAYCITCDGHKSFGKNTVVIGHQEEAAQAALVLFDRYYPPKLAILTNGKQPHFSAKTTQLLKEKNIPIIQSKIEQILGNKKSLRGFALANKETTVAEIAFVCLGIRPNNALALQLGAQVDSRGLVVTNEAGEASIEDVFVIGDLRANSMKQIYTGWQHAVDAVQIIDRKLRK